MLDASVLAELEFPILVTSRPLFREFLGKGLRVYGRCPRCGRVLVKWRPDARFLGALDCDPARGRTAALTADQTPPYVERVSYWCRESCRVGPVSTMKAESIVELLLAALQTGKSEVILP